MRTLEVTMSTSARRANVLLMCLAASVASAHATGFVLLNPIGAGNHPATGVITLGWSSPDAFGPDVSAQLYASPQAVSPFGGVTPADDVALTSEPVPLAYAPMELSWDTHAVPPGCYQPYAIVSDADGADELHVAPGVIAVGGGGVTPASVWITTPADARPDGAGNLLVSFHVDSPDAEADVALSWESSHGDLGSFDASVHVPKGGGDFQVTVSTASLPAGVYVVHAVAATRGTLLQCDAYGSGKLFLSGPSSAVSTATPERAASERILAHAGCSLSSAGPLGLCPMIGLLAAWIIARRRRA